MHCQKCTSAVRAPEEYDEETPFVVFVVILYLLLFAVGIGIASTAFGLHFYDVMLSYWTWGLFVVGFIWSVHFGGGFNLPRLNLPRLPLRRKSKKTDDEAEIDWIDNAQYYLRRDKTIKGPFTAAQLVDFVQDKQLESTDEVRESATGTFRPLKNVYSRIKRSLYDGKDATE